MQISKTNKMRALGKVQKQASDWFKDSVPFWRQNTFVPKVVSQAPHLQEISHLLQTV